ncbi:YfgM family protein [Methyloterricola oryzae]|uniref:YfgM family protein n=1 Tax=Methyloterricola oryzae TaxID=1495050 RepID=UPI0005EACDF0|nr:tetratricopeptide repeat protein [Methyloterricola oryzae]
MEIYLSEEERVEALKKWWKENAKAVMVGVALGLAIIAGWNAWKGSQRVKAEEASSLYQQLLKAVEAKQTEPATKLSERLIEQFQGTPYATYGTLFLARLKVQGGDLAGAKKALQDLSASVKDDSLKHLARVRLVRVMRAMGESEGALQLIAPLSRDKMGEFESLYEELKGDLYADLHRPDDARLAYEKARQLGESSPMLEVKINDLAAPPAQPAS